MKRFPKPRPSALPCALMLTAGIATVTITQLSPRSFAAETGLAAATGGADETAKQQPPKVGDSAPDFTLNELKGEAITLSKLTAGGPVVLVVLRGYPGYQCPVCNAQVGELLNEADHLADAGARVVLVYPGPADGLKKHADDFVRGKTLPAHFYLLLDPDYTFTNAYGLRWNAKNETAYPSTFVLDGTRKVHFAKISHTHGGRATTEEILQSLKSIAAQP